MAYLGFLVELECRADREAELVEFLRDAKSLVDDEPGTLLWFAFRRGDGAFAIFDVFASEADRETHLHGAVRTALQRRGAHFLAKPPTITPVDVVALKVPAEFGLPS